MNEHEALHNEPQETDVPLERRFEVLHLNLDLILHRCARQGVQPREWILSSVDKSKLEERFGAETASGILHSLQEIPDFNLADPQEFQRAQKLLLEISKPIIELDARAGRAMEWNHTPDARVGLFEFSIHDNQDGRFMMLHVPPASKRPGAHALRKSLHDVAELLVDDPSIARVELQSLLLEHPLAKKLGFVVEKSSDAEPLPTSTMTRDEFLERFGEKQNPELPKKT